jgi:hypothetical protein
MSTTSSPVDGGKVVVGCGREPWLAMRDLRKIGSIEARSAHDGDDGWDVIGITLVPGPIPDHASQERGATAAGWVAVGTLIRRPAAGRGYTAPRSAEATMRTAG